MANWNEIIRSDLANDADKLKRSLSAKSALVHGLINLSFSLGAGVITTVITNDALIGIHAAQGAMAATTAGDLVRAAKKAETYKEIKKYSKTP